MRAVPWVLVALIVGCGGAKRSDDPLVQDEEITRDIMSELVRHDRFADVRVTCRQGVALLEGAVNDASDQEQAKQIAWRITGVREVQSRLRLRSR